ncbi:MAG: efflux RND transporter periplasmic adaptor subunit [Candidatus Heteroscillospira sp.]|jgi:RND family efflux transporter MFP subunit
MKRKLLIFAAAAALLLGLSGCSDNAEAAENEPETDSGVAVQVETVGVQDISSENKISGKVSAGDERSIFIAANAKCTAVYVEAGDTVSQGDKICTLDLGSTLASYNAASASYNSSAQSYADQTAVFSSQIALLEKNVNDLQALYAIGAASQAEIDSANLSLQSAIAQRNATLSQLQTAMENAKSSLEQLDGLLENVDSQGNVLAPIDGTVAAVSAAENSYISNTMPVAVVTGAGEMKVTVSVSETLVPKLTIGDEVDVYVSSIGQSLSGSIRSVDQTANMQTKLYTVTVSVPDGAAGLLSGMFADVTFHTDTVENAVVVPTQAILTIGSEQHVFVVEDNTARDVVVQTGLTGDGITEIKSGLNEGEVLVTVGQTYLKDGDAVRIVSAED